MTTEPDDADDKGPRVVYLWYEPRGIANEGTVYIVPVDKLSIAEERLTDHCSEEPNRQWRELTGREARERAQWKRGRWAFTDLNPPGKEDTLEASAWLWKDE